LGFFNRTLALKEGTMRPEGISLRQEREAAGVGWNTEQVGVCCRVGHAISQWGMEQSPRVGRSNEPALAAFLHHSHSSPESLSWHTKLFLAAL